MAKQGTIGLNFSTTKRRSNIWVTAKTVPKIVMAAAKGVSIHLIV